jgi:hypothetical protein
MSNELINAVRKMTDFQNRQLKDTKGQRELTANFGKTTKIIDTDLSSANI